MKISNMAKYLLGIFLASMGLSLAETARAQEPPFSPDALLARYMHWQDQKVTIAAYPALFMSPGHWNRENMQFGAEPKPQTPVLVVCDTLTPPNENRITSADLVTLRGTFLRRRPAWSADEPDQIVLKNCEVLSIGGAMPQGADPISVGDTPIAVDALHEAVFDLVGKTVRVNGYYWGRTWSGVSDESRHDLQETAAFQGPKPVGCFQAGKVEAPQAVLDDRANTLIEGQIMLTPHSRPDRIDIGNCQFILPD